ncbi:hypothetical protein F4781DRAFT_425310 [Annulohypoxylon bovei var. microspora]|nr:hypothetical protein F4781DRAFT_425310 [Annulohypoxylon bovei var. microspora]
MAATAQVIHSSASSNHQQAPSTAPVLEFVCLFTRDLRRKQKRWQDGRLKYHTFNKRIMVYDDRGNFVGDTHWREDYDLNDGDEVELERGGVIVQVAECTGSRDQDLSELVDKRAQEKAERQAAALARRPPTHETAATPHAATPHFQLRHKPLHHLIGTPTGHHGRALMPTESPYEERQKIVASPQDDTARPAKRRRREVSPPSKNGYARSLFGAALTLSGTPTSTPLIRSRPPKASPDPDDDDDENSDSTPVLTRTTDDPLQSISVNLNTMDSDPDKLNPSRPKAKRNLLDDGSSVASTRSKRTEYPSLVSGSKTSIRSQGLTAASKIGNMPKTTNRNQEPQGLGQEQATSEPRTELRIKPRKKRGLMVVSENLEASISSRITKSRIDCQDLSTSIGDKTMGHLNNNVFNGDGSLDIQNYDPVDPADTSRFPQKLESDDEELVLSRSALSTKSKSRKRRDTERRRHERDSPIDEEGEDVPNITMLVVQDERERTTTLKPAHEDTVLAETARSPKRRKQSSRKKKRTPTEDSIDPSSTVGKCDEKQVVSEEEDFLPDSVPPPRLAHLGRKNIRSKEVIGFVFDVEEIDDRGGLPQSGGGGKCGEGSLISNLAANHSGVQATTSEANFRDTVTTHGNQVNTNDQCRDHPPDKEIEIVEDRTVPQSIDRRNTETNDVKATSKFLRKQAKSGTIQINADLDMQAPVLENTTAVLQPPSRIVVNPATRGKKAAKPSDAAGQVPQCPLPLEAAAGNSSNSGRHETDRRGSKLGSRTKEATITPMPKFARANGGPWSREAHDLFEFTRPP